MLYLNLKVANVYAQKHYDYLKTKTLKILNRAISFVKSPWDTPYIDRKTRWERRARETRPAESS